MNERDTTKIRRDVGGTRPTSARIRGLAELRTQNISLASLQARDMERLFSRLHDFQLHVGRLHEAKKAEELYGSAIKAVGDLYDLRHYEVLTRDDRGEFKRTAQNNAPPSLSGASESIEDLVHWALQAKQVIFYDLEEEGGGAAATGGAFSIGIMPVFGDARQQSVLVFWLAEPVNAMNVLKIDMLQALARDLSARLSVMIQTEKHARLSSLFDNILESVPHAVIAIAGDDRVIALNTNAEFLFGIKRIFVIDELYHEAFSEELVETFRGLISKSLLGEENADTEIEHALHGVTVNIGISVSFLRDRNGRAQGHLFLCRDLSLSREVQKLRELDQMKSEFVNTVSHELKTPLTAILGGMEIIEDDKASLPEDVQEILGVVSDGAHRLRDLIFDLLDVSRFETGKVKLKETLTDIRDVITESLRVQHPHANHTIVVEVPDDVPKVVMDRAKIIQCVTNYVSNAIKYSPKGGQVTVFARRDDANRRIVCGVRDQGLGIAAKHLEKIWQKFYRVDASYTSEIEGTGLGLVIVKHIVELHGGQVWAESEVGAGSAFFLTLPLRGEIADNKDDD